MPRLHDERPVGGEEARRQQMQAEQGELTRQREELELLRQQLEAQRVALERQQQQLFQREQLQAQQLPPVVVNNPIVQQPENVNAQIDQNREQINRGGIDIATIVSTVQNFHIDVKMPKFSNEMDKNPVEFLEELKKFFKVKNIKDERKIMMVEHALEGKASLWLELQPIVASFELFEEKFLTEFYPIPVRVLFKKQWLERRCNVNDESLQTYYYRQVRDARYFRPELTAYEVNYNIIQQYPFWVKETLATVNYSDNNLIGQTLASLDGIQRERVKVRDNRTYTNNNNNESSRYRVIPTVKEINVHGFGNNRGKSYNRSSQNFSNNGQYNQPRYNRGYQNKENYNTNNRASSHNFSLPDTRYPPPGDRSAVSYHQQNISNNVTPLN